ncbi:MAG: alkaline phosphatase family protein [Candidatus Acidiferrales bacterium]
MIRKNLRWMAALTLAANLAFAPAAVVAAPGPNGDKNGNKGGNGGGPSTTTPIKHLVVIFQENVSFDHYFGTYPNAANPPGETKFKAKANTPSVNGLSQGLLEHNQNAVQPFRLDPSQNYTCDQNHDYMPEQQAFDSGLMDKFPEFTATACNSSFPAVQSLNTAIVMGYYDGNTVTGLWNYAQNFALNDNFFGTNFGPSTPGALNVVSGMTGGVDPSTSKNNANDEVIGGSVIGDPDGAFDDCSSTDVVGMKSTNLNIGNLLSAKGISWGWFQGGFTPSAVVNGVAQCKTTTNRIDGTPETAYSAHHNPFEYYLSTSNPHHTPPKNVSEIGHDGQANHQYDLSWFQKAALAGNLPAVSYLKANRAQDGHPSNSSPLDEQVFLVNTINFLQSLPEWSSTAVIITWDDSDGWYDHVMSPILNPSVTAQDALTGTAACGNGANALESIQGRCGYGPRIPFLVVSLYAKPNHVDSTLTDFSSVVRFIEENWELPQVGNGSFDQFAGTLFNMFNFNSPAGNLVFLDPSTGQVVSTRNVNGNGHGN